MLIEQVESDRLSPGGRLESKHGTFEFESDFARDFRYIPMVVRFKLDRVGIKLSLKQWTKIGQANRQALARLACNTLGEVAGYRRSLVSMVEACSPEPIVNLPLDSARAWANTAHVPDEVVSQAASVSIDPPTETQWAMLDTLQRFALLKLARSNHDNHNFKPAMREFGLLRLAEDQGSHHAP